jgi:hypothetical protein
LDESVKDNRQKNPGLEYTSCDLYFFDVNRLSFLTTDPEASAASSTSII